jgi:hypothetical protein
MAGAVAAGAVPLREPAARRRAQDAEASGNYSSALEYELISQLRSISSNSGVVQIMVIS